MQKLSICVGQGQGEGLGARGWGSRGGQGGSRGGLKLFKSEIYAYIAL